MPRDDGRLRSSGEIANDPEGGGIRGKIKYTDGGFNLKKSVESETRKVGPYKKELEDKIEEGGNQYLSHYMDGEKVVVFVLYDKKKEPGVKRKTGTFVLLDDGSTRLPTTEEWKAHKTYYGMAGGDVKKVGSDDWEG